MEFNPWNLYNNLEHDISKTSKDVDFVHGLIWQALVKLGENKKEQDKVAALCRTRDAVICEVDRAKQELVCEEKAQERHASTISDIQKLIEIKKMQLSKMTEEEDLFYKFRESLAFTCRSNNGKSLLLCFQNVDKSDPKRTFQVDLSLENNTFVVVSCDPKLPNMKELEEELASTNNLRTFVVKIRRAWTELVLKS